MKDWSDLIAAMRRHSGTAVLHKMSDEAAALVEELRGSAVAEVDKSFMVHAPEVHFDEGLSDAEIRDIEARFEFHFPLDLRSFLQTALPVGAKFPDWRRADEPILQEWLERPLAGICFDIEHNNFWDPDWGPKPASLEEAVRTCRLLVAEAPRLIPVYGHRFMPDEPAESGNPVFSIYQADIIYYGHDLEDYIRSEFYLDGRQPWPEQERHIRFWNVSRWQEIRWSADGNILMTHNTSVQVDEFSRDDPDGWLQ